MIVYRIEDKKGYGPFVDTSNKFFQCNLLVDMLDRHGDYMLGIWRVHEKMCKQQRCAYTNLEFLKFFITKEEYLMLKKLGYKLYRIEVEPSFVDNDQVAFFPVDVISKEELDELIYESKIVMYGETGTLSRLSEKSLI